MNGKNRYLYAHYLSERLYREGAREYKVLRPNLCHVGITSGGLRMTVYCTLNVWGRANIQVLRPIIEDA